MLLIEEKQLHSGIITVCCTEGAVGDGIIRNSRSRNWYCSWEILYNGLSSHSAFFCQNGPFRAAGWHPPEMLHSWRKSVGQNDDQKFTSFCMFLLLLCTLRYFLVCNSTNLSQWYPPKNIPHISIARDTSRGMRSASPLVWTCDLSRSWPVLSTMLGFALVWSHDWWWWIPTWILLGKVHQKWRAGPKKVFARGSEPMLKYIYIYRNTYD